MKRLLFYLMIFAGVVFAQGDNGWSTVRSDAGVYQKLIAMLHGDSLAQFVYVLNDYVPVESYAVHRAMKMIADEYGDTVSIVEKNKVLRKFGTNASVGATQSTVMDLAGSETQEVFVYDNLIDAVSSSDVDNDQEMKIEGHTIAAAASVGSITRSNDTAYVVTTTAHSLRENDGVVVAGADQADYNGRFRVVSASTDTTFAYIVKNTPVTPATGTITERPIHYTFQIQTAYLDGQSEVSLSTPLATATRMYNNESVSLDASSFAYVYDNTGVTLSAGVPDVDDQVHLIVPAEDNQSRKASTTISNSDYWIITEIECSVNKKTTATVDVRVQVQLPYGEWRTIYPIISLSSTGENTYMRELSVALVVPRNSHFRFTAEASTTGVEVSASAAGYLAVVVN